MATPVGVHILEGHNMMISSPTHFPRPIFFYLICDGITQATEGLAGPTFNNQCHHFRLRQPSIQAEEGARRWRMVKANKTKA